LGQLSAKCCKICGGFSNHKLTCPLCTKTVDTFRGLIRNLQKWRSALEALEVEETICGPDGREWVLWDIERLYAHRNRLPEQQRRCIELFLYENVYEAETARILGVSASCPVAIYATVGLATLLGWARAGDLPGVNFEFDVDFIGGAA
jgi:hypothetical protein